VTQLTVATLFWRANDKSQSFSSMYDESWVEKLYRGFKRNLTRPFRFVCLSDREREYREPIEQMVQYDLGKGGYGDFIKGYALGGPMILAGLDTVVTGNCDKLADYCMTADRQALPRDPYRPRQACNGVALVPAGWTRIATEHNGQNDMEWVRRWPHAFIDDLMPGAAQSYKGAVRDRGLGDARICYFHGKDKPHEIRDSWVGRHWR
jgi:hypothetical protein